MKASPLTSLSVILISFSAAIAETPLGTAFTYQGQLKEAGQPATGAYDFQFTLYDAGVGGSPVGSSVVIGDWPVADGLFTVGLDFGSAAFSGQARWLEIAVRPGASGGSYTTLSPRQELTATPYALYALNGPGGESFWQAGTGGIHYNAGKVGIGTDTPVRPLTVLTPGNQFGLTHTDGTARLSTYIDGTTGGWLGTETNHALNFFTNNSSTRMTITTDGNVGVGIATPGARLNACTLDATALMGQSGSGLGVYGVSSTNAGVMGYNITSGTFGKLGDATYAVYGEKPDGFAGYFAGDVHVTGDLTLDGALDVNAWSLSGNAGTDPNTNFLGTTDNQPFIVKVNGQRVWRLEAPPDAYNAGNVIGGQSSNWVTPGVHGATIGGGGGFLVENVATDAWCTIGGGWSNRAGTSDPNDGIGHSSTVSGGKDNWAEGTYSTVGGGYDNSATGDDSTVAGGVSNRATGVSSTVGGGVYHYANGMYGTVPGGYDNWAGGLCSFAAGRLAHVRNAAQVGGGDTNGDEGTFVWADSVDPNDYVTSFTSTGPNQFLIRASGGVGIGTNDPSNQLTVDGDADFTGNVGIGESIPLTKLHVQSSDLGVAVGMTYDYVLVEGANAQMGLYSDPGGTWGSGLSLAEVNAEVLVNKWGLVRQTGASGLLKVSFGTDANPANNAAVMNLLANGNVGIDVDPTEKLDTSGTIRLRGIGASSGTAVIADANGKLWKQSSSLRYKHNVANLPPTGDAVLALRPVSFNWNSTGDADIGVIAEEVEQVLPDLVIRDADGQPDGVRYDKVALYLLGVVKAQREQIAAQQSELTDLQTRLERIEAALAKLGAGQNGGAR